MLFNSYAFWVFFICVYIVYWNLRHSNQNKFLLVSSYFFYGCWDWRFLSLILLSTVVDYISAINIRSSKELKKKKTFLFLSIFTNLGILCIFKYFNFFSEQLSYILEVTGFPCLFPSTSFVLPVGISFYTFQTMSYTIDVYRKDIEPIENFLDFALYVSFFPQLVAGPIERSRRLIPQIICARKFSKININEGIYLIIFGLFKKIVIADNMAAIANTIFSTPPSHLTTGDVLIGVYSFAFQIYGDFSGYTDIARGVANLLGFHLIVNFRRPYFSVSLREFWNRWHISLSTWLRDYLYISLGGNRIGKIKTYRNLILTMLLGGLWHGASWTFIIWGLYHGFLLCIFKIYEKINETESILVNGSIVHYKAKKAFRIIIVFHLVCLGWLFFRSETIIQAVGIMHAFYQNIGISQFSIGSIYLLIIYVFPLIIYEIFIEIREKDSEVIFYKFPAYFQGIAFCYFFLMILFFSPPSPNEFVYFQF